MEEKKRIIIAEDDAVLRDVMFEKLKNAGYLVEKADDGVVAMEMIRAAKTDCVLLDILMPRKGGMEVLEEMHSDPELSKIPVIIISNSAKPVEVARARELGARDFLIKAVFDPNEVVQRIESVLKGGPEQGEWAIRTQNLKTDGVSEAAAAAATAAKPIESAPDDDKTFVLVIEDDKFLRELLVRKLAGEGFDVKNAIDAPAAFAILSERIPKIILCDLILPGIDGFEILKRIKEDPKTSAIPVVILSNLGQKEDFEKAMGLGAKDFMVKANFTLDEIVTKVRSIVG